MLEIHPPPLATRVAGIAADLRATADLHAAQAGALAALHALILAAFVRLFDRLADLVTLWQSGQLPPPSRTQHRHPGSSAKADARSRATTPNPARTRQTARCPSPSRPVDPCSHQARSLSPRTAARAPGRRAPSVPPGCRIIPSPQSHLRPWPRAGPSTS